jgi:hypothetical protein
MYELKRRTGGNSRGRNCGGRRCWAAIRVARILGGTGDSGGIISAMAMKVSLSEYDYLPKLWHMR